MEEHGKETAWISRSWNVRKRILLRQFGEGLLGSCRRGARHLLNDSGGYSTDENDTPIEVSEIKIVAVYLRRNEP